MKKTSKITTNYLYKLVVILLIFFTAFSQDQTTHWRLIWNANPPGDNVLFYGVYRDIVGNEITKQDSIGRVLSPGTEYIDNNIEPGVYYNYKLRAFNVYGASLFSDPASACIPQITLPISIKLKNDSTINLNNYVNDMDTPNDSLFWSSNGGEKIIITILADGTAQVNINEPATENFVFTVMDADSFYSSKEMTITAGGFLPTPKIYLITK